MQFSKEFDMTEAEKLYICTINVSARKNHISTTDKNWQQIQRDS